MKNEPVREQEYEVLWPRSPRQTQLKPLAKRLDTLNGKTVVQLWDYLFRGDEMFRSLDEGLRARFPGINIVSWREFGSIHGAEDKQVVASLPSRFRELGADAVITAIGC